MGTSVSEAAAGLPPAQEYARRLAERRRQQQELAHRHAALGRRRNVVLGLVVALIILAEKETWTVKLGLLLPPILVGEMIDRRRRRTVGLWRRAERSAWFYERRLACVEERWAGAGETGERYLDERHPCAPDLDLFGRGCLFERLCPAGTRPGEDTLAGWLLAPAGPEEVRRRQEAVAELRDRLALREELALLALDVPAGEDYRGLAAWGSAAAPLPAAARAAVWLSTALTAAALASWLFLAASPAPLLGALLLQGGLAWLLRARTAAVLGPIEGHARGLAALAPLLARLEAERGAAARLKELQQTLAGDGPPASARTARLARLLSWAPLAALLAGRPLLALAVETWRQRSGPALGAWLGALGEFEALGALAAYSFENPSDPFPEVVEGEPCYEGEALAHPLLPRDRCVANDVCLAGELHLLVVSGSNMSGKSTLLRTVGVNAVLALAGAPVRARRLRLAPLVVGATLRIEDSLQEGRSRFYAEVLRVRQLLEVARGPVPLLFLLDELFSGTNSEDRRVGAEAVVRRLLDAGALGLVTTHDLALTGIAERLGPRAGNVHFEDRFEGGAMVFDYRMKPGVVQSSNGLALMRAVGIEV
jgi:hypothetical protein